MKTLLEEFYNTYKDTWFRKFESNKKQPTYYKISHQRKRTFEMIKYYIKTDNLYDRTTTMSMDHFSEFEIVEKDDPEYIKLDLILAKHLLLE